MASNVIRRPAITWQNWFPNGESLFNVAYGIYRTSSSYIPSEGLTPSNKGVLIIAGNATYTFCLYIDTAGKASVWSSDNTAWVALN